MTTFIVESSTQAAPIAITVSDVHFADGEVQLVRFDIEQYNARFTFRRKWPKTVVAKREPINPWRQPAILHVPHSVFREMRAQATEILLYSTSQKEAEQWITRPKQLELNLTCSIVSSRTAPAP